MNREEKLRWDGLPLKVMNCEARVLFVKDFLKLGLALIEGSKAAVCLFRGCQFIRPRGNIDSMSQWLPEGTKLRVHAKKESNSKMVAYLATSVWFEDEDYKLENVSLLYYPTDPENLETYNRVADDLTWGIKTTDKELITQSWSDNTSRDRESSIEDRKDRSDRHSRETSTGRDRNESSYNNRHETERNSESRCSRERSAGRDRDRSSYNNRHRDKSRRGSDDRDRSSYSSERDYRRQGKERRESSDRDHRDSSRRSDISNRPDRSNRSDRYSRESEPRGSGGRRTPDTRRYLKDEIREEQTRYRRTDRERSRGDERNNSEIKKENQNAPDDFGRLSQPELPVSQGFDLDQGEESWNNEPLPEDLTSVDSVEISKPQTKRERSRSPDKSEAFLPEAKRPRYVSPERDNLGVSFITKYPEVPPHTRWKYKDLVDIGPRPFNEIPADDSGIPVTIDSWLDEESGILCSRDGALISFHFNQMWESMSKSSWTQMREIYSSVEVRMKFPIGAKLRCYYSKRDLGSYQNQATMIWKEGPSPKNCRTQEYFEDLQRIAKNIKENQNVTNSMFSKCMDAVVQEYVSYETGLARMLDDDIGVALFSLDQVWDGKGNYLLNTDSQSLHNYLPIGSTVKVMVRTIPYERSSQLRYQATLIWKPEFGSSSPDTFTTTMSVRQKRVEMSRKMDILHDRFKQNALLSVTRTSQNSEPVVVPVSLNMLPSDGNAVVLSPLSSESAHFGLLQVSIPEYKNPNKMMTMYAIFHIDDVYDEHGKQLIKVRSDIQISHLKDTQVNLIARSIANTESYSGLKFLLEKHILEYKDLKIPLLQAVVVFINPVSGKTKTGGAPIPTFFRRDPSSFNRKQFGTAYYFNLTLRSRLDLKVHEYLECCSNNVSNASKHFLDVRFTDQKILAQNRRVGPRFAIQRLAGIDVHGDIKNDFGTFNPLMVEVASGELPESFKDKDVKIKVIWLDRPNPKYGLAKISFGTSSALAFFSINALNSKRYVSDLSSILWRNMKYVLCNAILMDASNKIPYLITELWIIGDKNPTWSCQVKVLKDEWMKVVSLINDDKQSLNFRCWDSVERWNMDNFEASLQKLESSMEPLELVVARSGSSGWRTSLKNVEAKVELILRNFGCASGYQELPGIGSKRFYVLFDSCDLYINNAPPDSAAGPPVLTDHMAVGDKIRLNAVHVEVENSWNLVYLASAVSVLKGRDPPKLPDSAIFFEDSTKIKPEKINNFKLVMTKIVKKTPPPEITPPKVNENVNVQGSRYKNHDPSSQRSNIHQGQKSTQNRAALDKASKASAARRTYLATSKPETFKELRSMEIQRFGKFSYDCKFCGIQGMSVEDAEDHISSENHSLAKNKQTQATEGTKSRFQDRGEAEEALFLNANKSVKVSERNGRRIFSCVDCKANNMPFESAKRHIVSQAHKKKSVNLDSAILDQECKEMRKRLERSGVVYHCTPCSFQTENITQNKEHILSEDHKRLTTLYCHVCKEFSRNKSHLQDHRFSIKHKKNVHNLEFECEKKIDKPKRPLPPTYLSSVPTSDSSTQESEPKDGESFQCKYCNFKGSNSDEFKDHENTASHKRRVFIQTQQMPSDGINGFESSGERCTTIEEMCLVREGKDLNERSSRDKSLRDSDEMKEAKERLLNNLFDGGVYSQMEIKTKVKCNTCNVLLNGKEKQLTMQLLAHLTGEKHSNNLRVQIKAEDKSGLDRNTLVREEEERERAAKSPTPEPEAEPTPEVCIPSSTAGNGEILDWLKTKSDEVECIMSDRLFYCKRCSTGLKTLREFFKHMLSEIHKVGMCPSREWRLYMDMVDVYEHGDGYFKCLPCNTEYMRKRELELHLGVMEHMQRFVDENKDKLVEDAIPVKSPMCSPCNQYFRCEQDLKIHERLKHKKDNGFTSDQIENLKTLSQSRNMSSRPDLNRAEGRILQVLSEQEFALLQISPKENQYINVLFDISRLEIKDKQENISDTVVPGYPVILTAVEMEPEVPGYSENIPYYATAVTIGDEDDHNSSPVLFSTLRSEIGSTIFEGQKLSKAALHVQLEDCANGKPTPIFHTFPNIVEFGTGIVIMKNQSVLLIKMQEEGCYALQILESVYLTENEYESSAETFEVGDTLHFNAVLLNPCNATQYLVTGCWSMLRRFTIPPSKLSLKAVDMYQTLALSYCSDPSSCSVLDMSSVLVPSEFGVGFDDIAEDIGEKSQDENGLAEQEGSSPAPFFRIKIPSFANKAV